MRSGMLDHIIKIEMDAETHEEVCFSFTWEMQVATLYFLKTLSLDFLVSTLNTCMRDWVSLEIIMALL